MGRHSAGWQGERQVFGDLIPIECYRNGHDGRHRHENYDHPWSDPGHDVMADINQFAIDARQTYLDTISGGSKTPTAQGATRESEPGHDQP